MHMETVSVAMESDIVFGVGAEIELQENETFEQSPVVLENKQDLPSWQTLHNFDDSSGDEGPDSSVDLSSKFGSVKGSCKRQPVNEAGLVGQPSLLNTTNNYCLQEQEVTSDTDKCKKVKETRRVQTSSCHQSFSISKETCTKISSTQEKKYSFYNVNTHMSGFVKPWIKNYKCSRCGREFRRLFNLESHVCVKMAMGFTQGQSETPSQVAASAIKRMKVKEQGQNLESNQKSTDLHKQLFFQSQTEPHVTQEKYNWESQQEDSMKSLAKIIPLKAATKSLPGNPAPAKYILLKSKRCAKVFKPPFSCDKCERQFKRKYNLDRHECLNKEPKRLRIKHGGAHRHVVDSNTGLVSMPPLVRGKLRFRHGEPSQYASLLPLKKKPLTCNDDSSNMLKFYTCQYCYRVFDRHCAYATHTHWHKIKTQYLQFRAENQKTKEVSMENIKSRVEKSEFNLPEGVEKIIIGENSGARLFYTCDKCGRGFRQKCSLVRHANWHIKHSRLGIEHNELETYPQDITIDVPESSFELVVKTEEEDDDDVHEKGHFVLSSEDNFIHDRAIVKLPDDSCKVDKLKEHMNEYIISESKWDFQTQEQKGRRNNTVPVHIPHDLLVRIGKKPKPSYVCRDCGARFHQAWKLKQHLWKGALYTGRTREQHKCDCGRSPVGKLHFLRHQLNHLSTIAFICAVCGLSLYGYRELRTHSWLHPLVSRFQCTCGAMFSQLPRYVWHSLLNNLGRRGRARKCAKKE